MVTATKRRVAAIVVGPHYGGKTFMLTRHLKPLLQIVGNARIFFLEGVMGQVFTSSLEERRFEKKHVRAIVQKYGGHFGFSLLVFAARPVSDPASLFTELKAALEDAGYTVAVIPIRRQQPAACAQDVLAALRAA